MSETPRRDWTEHDAELAALYRKAAQDEPPPALDDAIRAAAHRAIASKPRVAGLPFSRSWRVPLSIAAVVVLSVSLVTVMREQAPEVAMLPRADTPALETDRKLAESAPPVVKSNAAVPESSLPGAQKPKSVGLKPPGATRSEGIGVPSPEVSPEPVAAQKPKMAAGARLGAAAPSGPILAKRAAPTAFPGTADSREEKDAGPTEKLRQSAAAEMRGDVGVSLEAQQRSDAANAARSPAEGKGSTPAPVAAPAAADRAAGTASEHKEARPEKATGTATLESSRARLQDAPVAKSLARPSAPQMTGAVQDYAELPPAKWLEQIEEWRKQGKIEAAKSSLAAFRQRYPEYPLPATLKGWTPP